MRPETHLNDLTHFFEYSTTGISVVRDGLEHLSFGEYLVDQNAISRHILFQALQLQDQSPGVMLGECIAKLGALGYADIEKHLSHWNRVALVEA